MSAPHREHVTPEDIAHLAALARIGVTPAEAEALAGDFGAILGYVAQVRKSAPDAGGTPAPGAHHSVLRDDVETHEPDAYTEALVAAAPARDGRYVHVKKILGGTPGT